MKLISIEESPSGREIRTYRGGKGEIPKPWDLATMERCGWDYYSSTTTEDYYELQIIRKNEDYIQ